MTAPSPNPLFEQRLSQGFPPTVTDPVVLRRLGRLFRADTKKAS